MSTTIDTSSLAGVSQRHLLADWLPALDGVVDKLRSGAMVADVGSGYGESTILMARAFQRSAFTGYDANAEAITTARARAREALASTPSGRNVRFEVADADDIPAFAYDLVTTFGALHDLGDPLAVARRVRRAIADDGTWMIAASRAGNGVAVDVVLREAGFSQVRIARETPSTIVVEARP